MKPKHSKVPAETPKSKVPKIIYNDTKTRRNHVITSEDQTKRDKKKRREFTQDISEITRNHNSGSLPLENSQQQQQQQLRVVPFLSTSGDITCYLEKTPVVPCNLGSAKRNQINGSEVGLKARFADVPVKHNLTSLQHLLAEAAQRNISKRKKVSIADSQSGSTSTSYSVSESNAETHDNRKREDTSLSSNVGQDKPSPLRDTKPSEIEPNSSVYGISSETSLASLTVINSSSKFRRKTSNPRQSESRHTPQEVSSVHPTRIPATVSLARNNDSQGISKLEGSFEQLEPCPAVNHLRDIEMRPNVDEAIGEDVTQQDNKQVLNELVKGKSVRTVEDVNEDHGKHPPEITLRHIDGVYIVERKTNDEILMPPGHSSRYRSGMRSTPMGQRTPNYRLQLGRPEDVLVRVSESPGGLSGGGSATRNRYAVETVRGLDVMVSCDGRPSTAPRFRKTALPTDHAFEPISSHESVIGRKQTTDHDTGPTIPQISGRYIIVYDSSKEVVCVKDKISSVSKIQPVTKSKQVPARNTNAGTLANLKDNQKLLAKSQPNSELKTHPILKTLHKHLASTESKEKPSSRLQTPSDSESKCQPTPECKGRPVTRVHRYVVNARSWHEVLTIPTTAISSTVQVLVPLTCKDTKVTLKSCVSQMSSVMRVEPYAGNSLQENELDGNSVVVGVASIRIVLRL